MHSPTLLDNRYLLGKRICQVIVVATALLAAPLGRAECSPTAPSGHYKGAATSEQAGPLQVTLNLRCVANEYSGTADTSAGRYKVAGGSFVRNKLRLDLERNGEQIALALRVSGNKLHGVFVSGTDHGPVQLQRVGDALPPSATGVNLALSADRWRQDLDYLVKELTRLHPEPFAHTPRTRFEEQAAELSREIGHLDSDQIYMRMDHLANLIGDAHTYVEFPPDPANLPLDIRQFGKESRVVAVTPTYKKALGARVLAVGSTPIAKVSELAASITPIAETRFLKQRRIDGFITTGMVLHGLGITQDRDSADYVLAGDDGETFTMDFTALKPGKQPDWVYARLRAPLSAQHVTGSASCTYLAQQHAVYCDVLKIRSLKATSEHMLELLRNQRPDKVIIDLRRNGGGDYHAGIRYLIKPLQANNSVNCKGHLLC